MTSGARMRSRLLRTARAIVPPSPARLRMLETRLATLESASEDAQLRVNVTQEAMLLTETSRRIPKEPLIVLVEAPDDYGNLTALGHALPGEVGADHIFVVARDLASQHRWQAAGVPAHVWSTAPTQGAAENWWRILTAAVSVYEHHPWWREPRLLTLRALLAGSAKVQLWHGGAMGYGKQVAQLTLPQVPGMWQFADIATTSDDYAAFVGEPALRIDRAREFGFQRYVPDVGFRLVEPLRRAATGDTHAGVPRVLIAPTFPPNDVAATTLAAQLREYHTMSAGLDGDISIRFHPWTPAGLLAEAGQWPVISNDRDIYDVIENFTVIVSDFSSLSSDGLMLGHRVVLDHSNAAAFAAERPLRSDEAMLACCDVVSTPAAVMPLALDPSTDTHADARRRLNAERLAALGPHLAPTLYG